MDENLRRLVASELARAEQARREGREGRARVCARRAAGWALRDYYRESTGRSAPGNALELLRWYQGSPAHPELRAAALRLTSKVDMGFRLPHEEDPLEDARQLIEAHHPGATNR